MAIRRKSSPRWPPPPDTAYWPPAAHVLAPLAAAAGYRVLATSRAPQRFSPPHGVTVIGSAQAASAVADCTHLLVTAPPEGGQCPGLRALEAVRSDALQWVGYLSTTGVYGDHQGGWVDETTPLTPDSPNASARVVAENGWRAWADTRPCALLRLPAIYGPGRSQIDSLRAGDAVVTVKPGQVFSRIHVADIAATVLTCMTQGYDGPLNVADDEPAAPEVVMDYAAALLGLPLAQRQSWDSPGISPMTRQFYSACKRVRNQRLREHLGISLHYPTYREGLAALM